MQANVKKLKMIRGKKDGSGGVILDIKLNGNPKERVLSQINQKITSKHKFYIVTPNPEIVLQARKDYQLAQILNKAEVSIPDGIGLIQARRYLSLKGSYIPFYGSLLGIYQGLMVGGATFINRKWLFDGWSLVKGRELMTDLIDLAYHKKWRVYLLGGNLSTVKKASAVIKEKYKGISLRFDQGPILSLEGKPLNKKEELKENKIIKEINIFKPHLLFVGFGAPKQEKWTARLLDRLDVNAAMVVGGAIDYLAKETQPPQWMQRVGLEWLWRLFKEPRRIRRILNATIVFPWQIFRYRHSFKN